MDIQDLRSKSVEELVKLILDLRKEQFNMRFQKSQGALENTSKLRDARRSIAQVKTVLNEKRGGDAVAASGKKKVA